MQGHLQVASVQEMGCVVLNNVCYGTDAAALARKQRAVGAGGRGAAAAALQAHQGNAEVQRCVQQVMIDYVRA